MSYMTGLEQERAERERKRAELLDIAKHVAVGFVTTEQWDVLDLDDVADRSVSLARAIIAEVDKEQP